MNTNNKENIIFVGGIGTNVGKSYATGWLANYLTKQGKSVITQKMLQTGNHDYSEDIDVHRKVMGIPYTKFDTDHTTAPIIFSYPASPHLAAEIDKREIDLSIVDASTKTLSENFDVVLLEGVGGMMVPIKDFYLTIDYVKEHGYPVALVTNGTLGSINHTILTIEALKNRNIAVKYVIYNQHFDDDAVISADTVEYVRKYVKEFLPGTEFLVMPSIQNL